MQTLQFVRPWTIILRSYSSEEVRSQIDTAALTLQKSVDGCRRAAQGHAQIGERVVTIPDHGLAKGIDAMIMVIAQCAEEELKDPDRELSSEWKRLLIDILSRIRDFLPAV